MLLALHPLDQADAHYNLARTYHKMKDRANTRRQLLLALEAAPNYRPAQKLLLEMTRSNGNYANGNQNEPRHHTAP